MWIQSVRRSQPWAAMVVSWGLLAVGPLVGFQCTADASSCIRQSDCARDERCIAGECEALPVESSGTTDTTQNDANTNDAGATDATATENENTNTNTDSSDTTSTSSESDTLTTDTSSATTSDSNTDTSTEDTSDPSN